MRVVKRRFNAMRGHRQPPVEVNAEKRGCATTTSFLHHRRKAGGIVNIMHIIADARGGRV
jgi:hypothetical protein